MIKEIKSLPVPEDDWDYNDGIPMDDVCPNCNVEYDEIDYEYQICHFCKFNNSISK